VLLRGVLEPKAGNCEVPKTAIENKCRDVMGSRLLWITLTLSASCCWVGRVRGLNESDVKTLNEAGVTLLTALTGHNPDSPLPTYEGLTAHGAPAHVHFVLLGAGDDLEAGRQYWSDVIAKTAPLRHERWLQPILQSVDLGDICAIAVQPAQPLQAAFDHRPMAFEQVVALVRTVCQAMVTLANCGLWPLALHPSNVAVMSNGSFVFTPFTEFAFDQNLAGERTEAVAPLDHVQKLVSELADLGLCLPSDAHVLAGIARAICESESGAYAVGEFVLALDSDGTKRLAQREVYTGSGITPTEGAMVEDASELQSLAPQLPRWSAPPRPALQTNNEKPKRNKTLVVAAISGVVVLVGGLALVLNGGDGESGSRLASNTAVTSPPDRTSLPISDKQIDDQDLVLALISQRYERIAELTAQTETSGGSTDKEVPAGKEFAGVAVPDSAVWQQSQGIVNSLLATHTTLESPHVEVSDFRVSQRHDTQLEVEVTYTMTANVRDPNGLTHESSQTTESINLGLRKIDGIWLLETVTALHPE